MSRLIEFEAINPNTRDETVVVQNLQYSTIHVQYSRGDGGNGEHLSLLCYYVDIKAF